MSTLITEVRLLDPSTGLDTQGHLGFANGVITHAGPQKPKQAYDTTVSGKNLWVMPGIVDLAARLREPGATHKATIASEAVAARSAGITTLALPPDTQPPIDTPAIVDRIRGKAEAAGFDVRVIGALTKGLGGDALAEMSALKTAGCLGVSNAGFGLKDSLVGRRALEYAQGLGLTVHVFAQNPALANSGCAHEGAVATRLGLPSIPVAAEVSAIRFWISLVEDTGAAVHFGRLSTARGAELVEAAQRQKLKVTADVAAHQLFLTAQDVDGFNAMCHVIPPLRSVEDREGLRQALKRGVIQAICSDHQPHEADAKINPFPLTEPGISGLETLLPLGLRLVHEGVLTPLQLTERLSSGPAQILGISRGQLALGSVADLVLVDPSVEWTLDARRLLSQGQNTPFNGTVFKGRALQTWVRGHA